MSDSDELDKATTLLRAFAAAMAKWEEECVADSQRDPPDRIDANELDADNKAKRASCQAIFDEYCTDRPRPTSRPAALHYGEPSDYAPAHFQIDNSEFDKSRRVYIFTSDPTGTLARSRFTIVKKKNGWRIDDRHKWLNGDWKAAGL